MSVTIRENKNTILMTKADTLLTTINIVDSDGNSYIPAETDRLQFALKKNYDDKKTLIHKDIPIDTMELRVDSDDTKNLQQSETYCYDIQLTYGDGIVDTIISGKLRLLPEVCDT